VIRLVDFSKYQKNKDSESLTLEKKVSLMKDITEDKKAQILNFVGMKNIFHSSTRDISEDIIDMCPICNKRYNITQDKSMSKDEIIQWFTTFINKNKDKFTLDWLRGQKLTFESIYEMRK